MMEVEYNGISGSSMEIYAKELPSMPTAVRKESSIEIPGSDGTMYLLDGGYESTEIKISFNFIGKSEDWVKQSIQVRESAILQQSSQQRMVCGIWTRDSILIRRKK